MSGNAADASACSARSVVDCTRMVGSRLQRGAASPPCWTKMTVLPLTKCVVEIVTPSRCPLAKGEEADELARVRAHDLLEPEPLPLVQQNLAAHLGLTQVPRDDARVDRPDRRAEQDVEARLPSDHPRDLAHHAVDDADLVRPARRAAREHQRVRRPALRALPIPSRLGAGPRKRDYFDVESLQKPPTHVALEAQQSDDVLHALPVAEHPAVGVVQTGAPPSLLAQKPAQHS
jgi:hypothetical protein